MKTITLCILLMLSSVLMAQNIDNPPFKARTGNIRNITRIERTSENTRIYIHAIFRPHWWITEEEDSYLEDVATGKKYMLTSAEGIELNKKTYMPDSGEMDFVLLFEPLPKETQVIHLLTPSGSESNTFDISLVPQKKASPLSPIKGNWFKADMLNEWEYGVYDSITIMDNRIFKNKSIRQKGKRFEVTMKDKQNGQTSILLFTPQKDGSCKIQMNGASEYLYAKEKSPIKGIAPDTGFQNFFRKDTAYFQGYIDGYDPRLGFETGIIYLSNDITREDYPTVVPIAPDGSFQCKFVLNHPVENKFKLNNNWIPFYIEPGQTLTMYIDWENMMARSRARSYNPPSMNVEYMGASASISYLMEDLNNLISYSYDDLSKAQKTLTPNEYKEHMKPFIARWEQTGDSLNTIYQPSGKAMRLIQNAIKLQTGTAFLDFSMSREYEARCDTTNEVLKVREEDSYYDFLKEMPLDDETLLANSATSVFVNRFEYMTPFRKSYSSVYTMKDLPQVITTSPQITQDENWARINLILEKKKDEILSGLYNKTNPFLWQVAKVRHLNFDLKNIKTDKIAREYVSGILQGVDRPFMVEEAERMFRQSHPENMADSYRLPEGKATEIFRNIIKNHPGKILFVDFWATTCGPCRAGIESTAELRKKYKNHPEFQFIYISGQKESPEKDYKQYVEKHLKGEATYYLTDTEYNYLRQLFQFNGIPHYVLVEKDGSISYEDLGSHNIGRYLKKQFEESKP